eukprot:TRINITY_DN2094_c0_g1_i1.p1 TRINITY_DN2094_c0_g1~~TRINITY_DN2094_c0_g1_i1.p1  ORF type:complete len:229 (-),score=60.56 TRINITY_DN2094_c0_g1_i1:37-684(-)
MSSTSGAETSAAAEGGAQASGSAEGVDTNVKHPLEHSWTLWYDHVVKKVSQASWGDHLKVISTFATVEDFWGVYNNVAKPSEVASGSNFSLFKSGIEPKWEDVANASGGKWIIVLPAKSRGEAIDRLWLYTMLALIGEAFDEASNEICGAVVSIRSKQDKIALWTRHSDALSTKSVGAILKRALEIPGTQPIHYTMHQESIKRGQSFSGSQKYSV